MNEAAIETQYKNNITINTINAYIYARDVQDSIPLYVSDNYMYMYAYTLNQLQIQNKRQENEYNNTHDD